MSDALLRACPTLALPLLRLGDWPTPLTRAPALDRGASAVWLKREDLASPRYGGNKLRKLELLLPAARGGLLSLGAVGSNYLLACALHGADHGVPLEAVVVPQPDTPHARENARLLAAHARVWPAASELAVPLAVWRARQAALAERGQAPRMVWVGGSEALGTVGQVGLAFELAEQVAEGLLPAPSDLVVPLGSGGTAAGLTLGLAAAGLPTRVHAVRVADRPFANRPLTLALARRTRALLAGAGLALPPVDPSRLVVHEGWFGPGYGRATPEGLAAMDLAREALGLELEPTYTAKALAAALSLMAEGRLGPRVLLLQTLSATRPAPPPGPLPPEIEALLLR